MIIRMLMLSLALVHLNSAFAGTPSQKNAVNSLKANYSNIFQYLDDDLYVFQDQLNDRIFHNDDALKEIDQVFSDLQLSEDFPLVVSVEAKEYIAGIGSRVKKEYPDYKYNLLKDELFKNANPWKNLGESGSADLLLTAALTGPKVGLDIVSGGASKVANVLSKGGKIGRSIVRIGKNYTLLKPIKYSKAFSFIHGNSARFINLNTMKLMYKMDSSTFKVYEFLIRQVFATSDAASSVLLEKRQKEVISQYIEGYKDDTDNIIAQYFIQLKANQYKVSADLLGKSVLALIIDVFQTGVLTVSASSNADLSLISDLIVDLSLKGLSFVPIAGPFVETFDANRNAMAKIDSNFLEAQNNYITFTVLRDKENKLQLILYKLMVIENTIKEVLTTDRLTESTSNIDEIYGKSNVSISNIKVALNEWETIFPIELFRNFLGCFGTYIKTPKNERNSVTPVTKKVGINITKVSGTSICDIKNNYFSANLNLTYRVKEKKVQLYMKLKSRQLFKVPLEDNFSDIHEKHFYYPYVKFLAYKGAVDGGKKRYNPNDSLSQYEALKMTMNLLFKEEFLAYRKTATNHSDIQKARFDFVNKKITPITNISYSDKDKPISRGEIAELIMQLIYKKLNGTILNGKQYQDKITLKYLKTYSAKIDYSKDWNVFSAGLKALGISEGYKNGTYGLTDNIKRGEIAKLLVRAYQFVKRAQK